MEVDAIASQNGAACTDARQKPKYNRCNDDARCRTLAEGMAAACLPCIGRHSTALCVVPLKAEICAPLQLAMTPHTHDAEMQQH